MVRSGTGANSIGARGNRDGGLARTTSEAGQKVSSAIHEQVLRGGEGVRRTADMLHGTWLGHPLHPVLTDITVGAWTLGAAFDAVGELSGDNRARWVGDRLTEIGLLSAVPTAVAGLTDYSTVPKGAAGRATNHAVLNGASFALYALSLNERRRGKRRRGLALSALALGTNLFSALLGGHLVFRDRVGVDHSETFDGPQQWRAVLPAEELPAYQPRRVEVDGKGVLLYRDLEQVYAIGSVCSHAGGPLEQGSVRDCRVQCPWHDSVFDLRDGSIVHGPATSKQPAFEARERDGSIEIVMRS